MTEAGQRTGSFEAAEAPRADDDVVFTFSFETYADAARRGMMRPPDRGRIVHGPYRVPVRRT